MRHKYFVAGRYRDGALSDIWTDVTRCAERTFVAYAPACVCGWMGRDRPANATGHAACLRALLTEHAPPAPRTAVPAAACSAGSFHDHEHEPLTA